MALLAPAYGPVLGLTTTTTIRIMAGINDTIASKSKVYSGYLRFKQPADKKWSPVKRFRFNRNFYWTGVIELTDLVAGTEYQYQLGYDPTDSGQDPKTADWQNASSGKVHKRQLPRRSRSGGPAWQVTKRCKPRFKIANKSAGFPMQRRASGERQTGWPPGGGTHAG